MISIDRLHLLTFLLQLTLLHQFQPLTNTPLTRMDPLSMVGSARVVRVWAGVPYKDTTLLRLLDFPLNCQATFLQCRYNRAQRVPRPQKGR